MTVDTKTLIQKIVEGMQERKAKKIVTVDMTELENYSCPYFVICEGNSTTHVVSIADSVKHYVRSELKVHFIVADGYENGQWIAIDYGEIIVHVMLPEMREFYRIEELWEDAKITEIPDLD